jgi:hypothetical protein
MRHRFGQESGFGSVSRRDRHNADLFFSDLLGRGPRPSARAVETFHEAWVEDDPPPTVTKGKNDDEIIVRRADGTRYVVRRKVRARVVLNPGRFRTGLCWTAERVFGRATWCQGTQGTIDVGTNLPGAAKRLLDTVTDQINSGGRPEDIARTLENAQVQTFVEVSALKQGSWGFTGDFRLELTPSGILSKSASATLDKQWFKVGVEYQDDGTGKRVIAKLDIPFGKRTVRGKQCEENQIVIWWEAECFREVTRTDLLDPLKITKQETLYLYFEYAKDLLRRDPKATSEDVDVFDQILRSTPKLGTALLNKQTLERLDYLVGQGYWVDSVKGYTSPEGRRGPPNRGTSSRWEGNEELSRERAEKVRRRIEDRYGGKWLTNPMPPRMRFQAGKSMPAGVGLSENPSLDERPGVELEGAKLDDRMIHGDKKAEDPRPFIERFPGELARMTEDDGKFVRDARLGDRKRAERLFENLRRVEIHLQHREELGTRHSYTDLEHEHDCPADVTEAAQRQWGSMLPLFKADPPVCG